MEMIGSKRLLNGLSELYVELCEASGWARRLYWDTAAVELSIPAHVESLAAWEAALSSNVDIVNRFLEWAYSRVPKSRVCVLGPLAEGKPDNCDVIFSVQLNNVFGVDAIFTDLDSPWPPLEPAAAARWILVHVHGDNWKRVLATRVENAIYTSQAYCIPPVLGIGGFTDGDRPVVLASTLGASEILLYGYSEEPTCSHKNKNICDPEVKRVKLSIAWRIIKSVERIGYIIEYREEPLRLKPL